MPNVSNCHYIVVEGPIGAGKTGLARRLGERLSANLLLEDAGDNPFLSRFYQDPTRNALPTQLFFLFRRAEQTAGLRQLDMFGRPTVADFLLDKDPLFARLNLNDDEFALYQKIYGHLQPSAPAPDLVIYLQPPVEVLADRLRRRSNGYEADIAEDYLKRLSECYSRYFYEYTASPLLIVNNENMNFAEGDEDYELLLARIRGMRSQREFFNRAG